MEKLNLKMEKLNFPGTDWRGLALIGAQKNPVQATQAEAICLRWLYTYLAIPYINLNTHKLGL